MSVEEGMCGLREIRFLTGFIEHTLSLGLASYRHICADQGLQ